MKRRYVGFLIVFNGIYEIEGDIEIVVFYVFL